MLLTERQITAQEACDGGLVTRIFSEDRFRDEVDKVVKHMASLPPQVHIIFICYIITVGFSGTLFEMYPICFEKSTFSTLASNGTSIMFSVDEDK